MMGLVVVTVAVSEAMASIVSHGDRGCGEV